MMARTHMHRRDFLRASCCQGLGLTSLLGASGAGAVGNRTIGAASAGGMALGTLFGVLLVPGLFVVVARLQQRLRRSERAEWRDVAEAG